MAMESQFNDFRLRRDIGERVRERRLKHYKDCKVLSSLTRLLIMESTRLVSDPRKTTELIQYDIRTHQKLSLNNLFVYNKMHIVTKGLWPYPAKSFFLFAHNQPIKSSQLLAHPLIEHLGDIKTLEQLLALSLHPLMPSFKHIDFRGTISPNFDIDLVEFHQSFYTEAFTDPNNRPSDLEPLKLRLCAFVDLK